MPSRGASLVRAAEEEHPQFDHRARPPLMRRPTSANLIASNLWRRAISPARVRTRDQRRRLRTCGRITRRLPRSGHGPGRGRCARSRRPPPGVRGLLVRPLANPSSAQVSHRLVVARRAEWDADRQIGAASTDVESAFSFAPSARPNSATLAPESSFRRALPACQRGQIPHREPTMFAVLVKDHTEALSYRV